MTTAECIHGIEPAWCSLCKTPIVGGPKAENLIDNGPFRARFSGHCTSCNLPIYEGQQVYRWTDEQWRHEGCKP